MTMEPYLALLLLGFLPSEVWRWIGLLIGRGLDVGPAVTGLPITVVVIGIGIGAWLMGPLSDRIGRRAVMFGSCALLAEIGRASCRERG